jgi:Protein of unknown function (DUF1348)
MRSDSLVDRLDQQARPVQPRSVGREVLLLLAILESTLFPGFMRPETPTATAAPPLWWKPTNMGLAGTLGAEVSVISADPVRSPRRIAVRLPCEYLNLNDSGYWFRASRNEIRPFDAHGLTAARFASINERPIAEAERHLRRPPGCHPDGHPSLSDHGL